MPSSDPLLFCQGVTRLNESVLISNKELCFRVGRRCNQRAISVLTNLRCGGVRLEGSLFRGSEVVGTRGWSRKEVG